MEHKSPLLDATPVLESRNRSHKRNVTTFVVICLLNLTLLALIWTLLLTPAQNQPSLAVTTRSTSNLGDINSPLIGKPAPDFTLPVLSTDTSLSHIHLADLKGKPVVLNFWASWCAPCNDEAPLLQKAWPHQKAQGVVFIGIDAPENTSNALKFLQKYTISYSNVQDTMRSTTAIDYDVAGLPETIFIDRNGMVMAKWASPLNQQGLQQEMAKLLR
ncbi:MAG TPA: TlpA disulfide reductase family protein [Ktedonobacteraceae bacterium]|nr:TlpA disulfide reductase family protein [Ktedonobacteraceae bacterium]